ncbi:sperm flagellar protein 2-like [Kogia breviceps]|uniref:sperm flagellar protein 2-like n=1 Tax=Kogia breviceps TaxID=27615 RepID=UPI0034D2E397
MDNLRLALEVCTSAHIQAHGFRADAVCFPIQVLSIDTLVQEAIQAFHNNEKSSGALQKAAEEKAVPVRQESSKESQASTNTRKTSKAEEVIASDSFSELTVRAQLGAKSEKLLKKGKSISDTLLVSILVNAIKYIPISKGWVLDGFPMTLNQAKLLEEALTGCNRNLIDLEGKKSQISTLAVDPTTSREVPLPSSAFDFVMLLDISDNSSLNRMNDIMAEAFSSKTPHEDINQRVAAKNQDVDEDQNLRDQIQHRIVGFLDNWPLLEQWFTEPENILIKINADIDKQSLCQKVKEMFMTEIMKKENKGTEKSLTIYAKKKQNSTQ